MIFLTKYEVQGTVTHSFSSTASSQSVILGYELLGDLRGAQNGPSNIGWNKNGHNFLKN